MYYNDLNYFAIADGISSGKFINLRGESDFLTFDQASAILVKKQIAEEELKASAPETTDEPEVETNPVEAPQTPSISTGPFSAQVLSVQELRMQMFLPSISQRSWTT